MENALDAVFPLTVTCKTKLKVPTLLGVPLIEKDELLPPIVSPSGRAPLASDHACAPVIPPLAVNAALYGAPTAPFGKEVFAMPSAAITLTVNCTVASPLPPFATPLSSSVMDTLYVPGVVGVPDSTPEVLRVSPGIPIPPAGFGKVQR